MFVLFRGTAGDGEVASYHGAIEAGGECEGLHVAEASFSSCAYADDGVGQDEAVDGEVAEDFKRLRQDNQELQAVKSNVDSLLQIKQEEKKEQEQEKKQEQDR